MNVNPGELNKKIVISKLTKTTNENGFATTAKAKVLESWASFSRTSGTELIKANADFSIIKARFLIRYTKKDIDRKMVVTYAGTDYQIEYVNNYQDSNEYMEIWCSLKGVS